jgi:hypothetical protein
LNPTNSQQKLGASGLPRFAARHFARKPLATSLPQDSPRELMFEPCAKHNPGASASLHSNFATLRQQRIDHPRNRASHNCFMRRLNPPRTDRRSMPVALKPFDRLDFLTARSAKSPRNSSLRRNSVATRLRFAARLDVSNRFSTP